MAKRKNDEMVKDMVKKAKPTEPSRALYIGNLDPSTTYSELIRFANQYGPLEFATMKSAKSCAFVNFLEMGAAQAMYNDCNSGATIADKKVAVGWAKCGPLSSEVSEAVAAGASRCLFLAGVKSNGVSVPEEILHQTFSVFGEIEKIVIQAEKGIAFVNMTSVKSAMKAVAVGETTGIAIHGGGRLVVKYAKEKIAKLPAGANMKPARRMPSAPKQFAFPGFPPQGMGQAPHAPHGAATMGSRAIFLGNVPAEATYKDLCSIGNTYGALEWVRHTKEKNNAFLNFIDPMAAAALMEQSQQRGLTMGETQVRVGWAKSAPLNGEVLQAMGQGATRNLFVGNLPPDCTEESLKALFGPICNDSFDNLTILAEKKIAFVNMTNIKFAIAAKKQFDEVPAEVDGFVLKVNYAKEGIKGQGKAARAQHYQQAAPQQQYQQAPPQYQQAPPQYQQQQQQQVYQPYGQPNPY